MSGLSICCGCFQRGASTAIAGTVLAFSGTAAADHTNLEEGLPVEVTDAYSLEYLGRELQTRLQYRYTPDGAHEAYVEPRFEFGIPYNGQIAVRVPLVGRFVEGDEHFDLGRVALDYMYNLNQETLSIPAFAIVAGVEAPDTRDGGSVDPFARILVTKMISGSTFWHRVHLNATVQGNVNRKDDERSLRYLAVVGYDFRLNATMIGVIDAVRDQPLREEPATNFGEIGVRLQVTPLLALAFGGGAGTSDDGEPVARGTAAFQWFAF